jgi:hypothetical protein
MRSASSADYIGMRYDKRLRRSCHRQGKRERLSSLVNDRLIGSAILLFPESIYALTFSDEYRDLGSVAGKITLVPKQFLELSNLLGNIFLGYDTRNSAKSVCSGSNYLRRIGMIYSTDSYERDVDLAADLLD